MKSPRDVAAEVAAEVAAQVEDEIAVIEAAHPEYSHRDILLIFTALVTAIFLSSLDNTIVATALPRITEDLGAFRHLAWVVTAYLLASTVSTPLWAKFGDLRGRKRILQMTIVVFLVGSVLCGLAQNLSQLIGARFLQGIGGGGIIVMVQSTIAEIVPARQRGRYQGYTQATFAFASIVGPLIGGVLVQTVGWRWIFYVNLPIGAAALVLAQVRLKLPVRHVIAPVDYMGASLLVSGLTVLVLYTVNVGQSFAFVSWASLGTIAVFAALTGGFILRELRTPEPILPLRLFKDPTFRIASIAMAAATCALFGSTIYLPVFNQVVRGDSPTVSGLLLTPMMLGLTVASTISGRRIARKGTYKGLAVASLAAMTVSLVLLSFLRPSSGILEISCFVTLFGVGYGPTVQVLIQAVQYSAPRRDIGAATGSAGLSRMLGGSIGTAVFGAIFAAGLTPGLVQQVTTVLGKPVHGATIASAATEQVTNAISHVFLVAAVIAALGTIAALRLPNRTLIDDAR